MRKRMTPTLEGFIAKCASDLFNGGDTSPAGAAAGAVVWARARGFWRLARIVRVYQTRVDVVFRLSASQRLVRQRVPLTDVKATGTMWLPAPGQGKFVPVPSMDQARAADLLP